MKRHFFDLMLKLLKVRKDKAVTASQQIQRDLKRVQGFKNQLENYASEYEGQWARPSRSGQSVQGLQVQMAFGSRLRDTAQAQEPEIKALIHQADSARQQVLQYKARLETLQAFQQRKKQQVAQQQVHQEQREFEDILQARIRPE
jgi:flagellar export protein FliJ